MAKYIYKDGELHSNHETVTISNPDDATKLATVFPRSGEFTTSDGTKQYLISLNGDAFVVLNIDPQENGIGEKEQCNNYADCPEPTAEEPAEGA